MRAQVALSVVAGISMIGVAFAADAPQRRTIPIFATGPNTGWVLDRAIGPDDLIAPPEGGPGPITYDRAYPYVPNNTPGKGPSPRGTYMSALRGPDGRSA